MHLMIRERFCCWDNFQHAQDLESSNFELDLKVDCLSIAIKRLATHRHDFFDSKTDPQQMHPLREQAQTIQLKIQTKFSRTNALRVLSEVEKERALAKVRCLQAILDHRILHPTSCSICYTTKSRAELQYSEISAAAANLWFSK